VVPGRDQWGAFVVSGLKSWNFWTPINGTLYGYRAYHPDDFLLQLQGASIRPRVIYAYGGKTIRRWEKRMEEHMWGGGQYDSKPKPWADTVPGWRPDGTVDDIIAAGGVYRIWHGRTVPLLLSLGEVVYAIKLKRPYYNHQWNLGNRRRIPLHKQENQRQLRDLTRGAASPVGIRARPRAVTRVNRSWVHNAATSSPAVRRVTNIPRWIGYYQRWIALFVLTALGAMFLPGMPGQVGVEWVWLWTQGHRTQITAWAVLVVALLVVVGSRKPKRRKSRR
jgi:hypothetical protein